MRVAIRGHNLPGRTFCGPDHQRTNVHVAVQMKKDAFEPVVGDASAAAWDLEVVLAVNGDGELDFKGPAVHGKRGERFLYLTWGDVDADGTWGMFRRAKLMLNHIDPTLIRAADVDGKALRADVDLTDECGAPRCARLREPALRLSVTDV